MNTYQVRVEEEGGLLEGVVVVVEGEELPQGLQQEVGH